MNKNLAPLDLIEWMPFLQAYAQQGDIVHLEELAPKVISDPIAAQQACHILRNIQNLTPEALDVINTQYCIK